MALLALARQNTGLGIELAAVFPNIFFRVADIPHDEDIERAVLLVNVD